MASTDPAGETLCASPAPRLTSPTAQPTTNSRLSQPFVRGFRAHLSHDHPAGGCICDQFAGDYPKGFKFVGWHPHCLCYVTAILADDPLHPEDTPEVKNPPTSLSHWLDSNSDRVERAFASGKPAYWLRDNSALLKLTKVYENLGFSVVKIYDNGGMVLVHRSAETKKGDYKDLMEIAHAFASQGSFVQIPPRIHRDEKIYNEIYRTRGMKYYGKCPDLIIDGKNYEYESFQRPWNKRKLSHQLSNGLKQSDRIIIDTRDSGLKHPFIRKAIFNRIKGDPNLDIAEVWTYDGEGQSTLVLVYEKHRASSYSEADSCGRTGRSLRRSSSDLYRKDTTKNRTLANAKARHEARTPETIADIQHRWDERNARIKRLDRLEKARLRHEARTPEEVAEIKRRWEERRKGNDEAISPTKHIIDYKKDSTKDSYRDRLDNVFRGLDAWCGTEGADESRRVKPWLDNLKRLSTSHSERAVVDAINDALRKNEDLKLQLTSIEHWIELSKAKDLQKVIPTPWRSDFNAYIRKIESMNVEEVGFAAVYREVEGAYNIYKLAKSKMAREYGLDRISNRMPHALFEQAKKKLGFDITETMPKREFFDSFDKYIPMHIGGSPVCHFSPSARHVILTTKSKDRFIDFTRYRTNILYHEFGHAKDHLDPRGVWRDNSLWKELFRKYEAEVNRDQGRGLEAAIRARLREIRTLPRHEGFEVLDALGDLSDTLQALVKGHRFIEPAGHRVSYWSGDKMLAEFIAHASENHWQGNKEFERLFPELYRDMIDLVSKMR